MSPGSCIWQPGSGPHEHIAPNRWSSEMVRIPCPRRCVEVDRLSVPRSRTPPEEHVALRPIVVPADCPGPGRSGSLCASATWSKFKAMLRRHTIFHRQDGLGHQASNGSGAENSSREAGNDRHKKASDPCCEAIHRSRRARSLTGSETTSGKMSSAVAHTPSLESEGQRACGANRSAADT